MDIESAKKMFLGSVPAGARKYVIAYAMQATILGEIEATAIKAGATKVTLEMARGVLPMLLGMLEKNGGTG